MSPQQCISLSASIIGDKRASNLVASPASPVLECMVCKMPFARCMRRALVDGRIDIPIALVDDMVTNLEAWQQEHFVKADGCFFQSDTLDGGEDSISSGGCRVSINSVMVRMFSNMQDPDGLNVGSALNSDPCIWLHYSYQSGTHAALHTLAGVLLSAVRRDDGLGSNSEARCEADRGRCNACEGARIPRAHPEPIVGTRPAIPCRTQAGRTKQWSESAVQVRQPATPFLNQHSMKREFCPVSLKRSPLRHSSGRLPSLNHQREIPSEPDICWPDEARGRQENRNAEVQAVSLKSRRSRVVGEVV